MLKEKNCEHRIYTQQKYPSGIKENRDFAAMWPAQKNIFFRHKGNDSRKESVTSKMKWKQMIYI